MGRRGDELAESGSRDFCFSTRVGFGSLAEDALPLNNASSLSILHRRLGTGLGSLASPIGGAAENAGSSALAGAPCAANMQCGELFVACWNALVPNDVGLQPPKGASGAWSWRFDS